MHVNRSCSAERQCAGPQRLMSGSCKARRVGEESLQSMEGRGKSRTSKHFADINQPITESQTIII